VVINLFITIILIISPLLGASWDLWAQTVVHLITLIALLILIFSKKEISVPRPSVPIRGVYPALRCGAHPRINSGATFLFIFLFFCFISIFSSANFYESRNEFFNILNYVVIFYFAKNIAKKYIVAPALISGVILSIYGFYQKFSSGGNVPSFMNNPNVFAGYITGIIVLTFGNVITEQLFASRTSVRHRTNVREMFGFFFLLVFLLAMFFTGSVAGLLSVAAGLLFFLYLKKISLSKKYLFFSVGIILFFIAVKLAEKESFNRVIWWLTAGKMILAKPIFGIGLNAFADAYSKYKLSGLNSIYAHNYFLQLTSEIGVFGFAAFVWFLTKVFDNPKTSENIPFFAASFAMLIHGIFDYALLIPANSILFWIMLGYCSKEEKFMEKPCHREHRERAQRTQRFYVSVFSVNSVVFSVHSAVKDFFQKVIFRWISVFLISAISYSQIMIFLASRETARGKYFLDEKKYDIAKNHLMDAIKYDAKNPQTYFFLSNVYQQYYKMTGYKSYLYEAELELLKAAEFQKYNSQIYFDLYNIYYLRGNKQNAILWLKKTLDVAPKSIYYEKCYETLLKEIYENTQHK